MNLDLSEARWRKSSRSGGNGGACVEVALVPDVVAVRDSKNPDGPVLCWPAEGWGAFHAAVKAGRFDLV